MLKITIITVCYNEKQKIKDTIESVQCQSYPYIEYLIMDGASTDGTLDVLQEYSKYKNIQIYSEKDRGIYHAMNRGVDRATGDYVFFLNAGDRLFNEHVIEDVASYIGDEKNAIYYGKVYQVYADGMKVMEDFSKHTETQEEKLISGGMPCHQCIFSPRKILAEHNFIEEYKMRADYEWLLYSVSKGYHCKYIPITISYYGATGMSSRFKNYFLREYESKIISEKYRMDIKTCEAFEEKSDEMIKWRQLSQKHFYMFQLLSQWMGLSQRHIYIETYLQKRGYKSVAIYGMSFLGQRLYDELRETDVKVAYAIDQNAKDLYTDLPVFLPTDELLQVDLIIVTTILYFYEVREKIMEKVNSPIMSLEDIIYEMADHERLE